MSHQWHIYRVLAYWMADCSCGEVSRLCATKGDARRWVVYHLEKELQIPGKASSDGWTGD